VSVAALPMEPPFDTPLQPLSEAQLQVQTFALQVSAVPCVKVYPSAHAVVWLLLALLHVMVTPSLEFATAVQALHTALVLPEHFALAKKPLPHVVHALQVSALPSASTR